MTIFLEKRESCPRSRNEQHTRNNMIPALDFLKQMGFQIVQLADCAGMCAHEWLAGFDAPNFSHCRRAESGALSTSA